MSSVDQRATYRQFKRYSQNNAILSTREEFQITTDASSQRKPTIHGDVVVWQDFRNGNKDIYGYNLSTEAEFQITTNLCCQDFQQSTKT